MRIIERSGIIYYLKKLLDNLKFQLPSKRTFSVAGQFKGVKVRTQLNSENLRTKRIRVGPKLSSNRIKTRHVYLGTSKLMP